jgi:NDP-sugar pyrophosphorylase family protein
MSLRLPPLVIQAGGKGERMKVGGLAIPKVLLPVQGMPLLERLIRQLVTEGAREFFILTGYAAEQVEAHVKKIELGHSDVSFTFIRETESRGNIGALAELAGLDVPVLFAFGDLFTRISFRLLYSVHQERGASITAASHVETHRLQLGHLIVDDNRVIDYREKPEYEFLICSGIMAIAPEVLRLMPKSGIVGMNRLVLIAIEAGLDVTHWRHGAFWMDINTPELLERANEAQWE